MAAGYIGKYWSKGRVCAIAKGGVVPLSAMRLIVNAAAVSARMRAFSAGYLA